MSKARLNELNSNAEEGKEGKEEDGGFDLTLLYLLRDIADFVEGKSDEVEFAGHRMERGGVEQHQLVIEEVDGEPKLQLLISGAGRLLAGGVLAISSLFLF